ncbi:MAG: glycosyltransferase [Proteobacteria bacterium]|nr:glycosyltransferase [Pseudomonadota bacterium]
MSLKRYGMYLAYPPTVDLRHDGLGRHLASFLKGAAERRDVHFVLVCPSWAREGLQALFKTEGVDGGFELTTPAGKPVILRWYEAYLRYKNRVKSRSLWYRIVSSATQRLNWWVNHIERRLGIAYSVAALLPVFLELAVLFALLLLLAIILGPIALIVGLAGLAVIGIRRGLRAATALVRQEAVKRATGADVAILKYAASRFGTLLHAPKDNEWVLRLYKYMEEAESERMLRLINGMHDVRAWYSPSAFWPAFNKIRAPRLMCVPDVVLTEFPATFAKTGGSRYLKTFEAVEKAIYGGRKFVTYSDAIKYGTLVGRYGIRAEDVTTILHAPSDLSRWVSARNIADGGATERYYCKTLVRGALARSTVPAYSAEFLNTSFKYLFYASQFRPNKNLTTLITAYEHLLRKRHIGHKLLLTGSPQEFQPVRELIEKFSLQNDVLCLYKLPVQELAACYKLADLAINPSLSEGGCPFTFTEALSVGTPVVMADIPVSEEVLTDPELRQATLFDAYDWRAMARHIEWAIGHREELLRLQSATYSVLARRTWSDVVGEHIDVLERIAGADGLQNGRAA